MDALIGFITALPAHIINGAGWAWDHRWYAPLGVVLVGGLGLLLTHLNANGRQVRDLWRKR